MYSETDGVSDDNVNTPSEISRQFIVNKIKGIEINNLHEFEENDNHESNDID